MERLDPRELTVKPDNILTSGIEQRSSKTNEIGPASRFFQKYQWRLFIAILVISDLSFTFLAFQAAYYIRFMIQLPIFNTTQETSMPYYNSYMLSVLPIWLLIFVSLGLYNRNNLLGGTSEYSLLFNATTFGMFLNVVIRFAFTDFLVLARGWIIIAWFFAFIFTAASRFTIRRVVYQLRHAGYFQKPAILIGLNDEGILLADQINSNKTAGIRISGYVCHSGKECLVDEVIPYLGELSNLDDIIKKYGVDVLILSTSALSQDQVLSIFRRYGTNKSIDLRLSSGLYEIITTGMTIKEEGLVPMVVVNKVRLTGVDQVLKSLIDYSVASAALILLSPLLIIIAIAVAIDSPGSIFYRRRVMGVNGIEFDAFKFRTMDQRSDEILNSNIELLKEYRENFKIKKDPRITRIGKILRKTSLDELPQLINVLKNEMSIVGPRMITPQELEKYNQWDINLMTVKPGITGLWQVRGRSDISYEDRVRLDMYYIRNWNIWMDLQIIMQTIPAVLHSKGAY